MQVSTKLANAIRNAYAADVSANAAREAVYAQLKADGVRRVKKAVAAIIMPVVYKAAGVELNEKGSPDRTDAKYAAAQRCGNRMVNEYCGANSAQYDFDVPAAVAKAAGVVAAWAAQFESKAQPQARKAAFDAAK
jgi:hypothetical protein